jgi:hypothetical protein
MSRHRRHAAVRALCVGSAVLATAAAIHVAGDAASGRPSRGGPTSELDEERDTTLQRLDALAQARAEGTFGEPAPLASRPAAGWSGERLLNVATDDWEPAVAADPNAPYVYLLTTRYGETKPCPGKCPTPFIVLAVSADGGATFGPQRPLCACKSSGQFDPIVEVVRDTGHVYAVYMNGFDVVFVKSTDRGQTWSTPVKTYGTVAWTDKPVLAVSDDGRDVYVSWNGPKKGAPWAAVSHDAGATWTQTRLDDSGERYHFAYDADVLPDGTVVFSEGSLVYPVWKGTEPVGPVRHHAFVSADDGATWRDVVLDEVQQGEPCAAAGCGPDFYFGHSGVSADDDGDLVFLYDGATAPGGRQSIFARRSSDGGLTWSNRVVLSAAGEQSVQPSVEQTGDGDVRAFWSTTAGGDHDRWSVWYRRSQNGGSSWSAPVRLSDAAGGAGYKTATGFLEVYGDYGEIAVTSTGDTFATWGEGFSWTGPGGTWYALGR